MARYSEEHVQTIRERMIQDMQSTFRQYAVNDTLGGWAPDLLAALVEDGMHPLEKIIADIHHEDVILGRYQ